MNTKIRIRLLLVVLAFGLAAPGVARADTIQVGYVIFQDSILTGPSDNPTTTAFYFSWLVDPLPLTAATFSVLGIGPTGAPIDIGSVVLGLPIDDSSPLAGLEFPTSARLTSASFRGFADASVLTLDGQTYSVAGQTIIGGIAADPLTPWPFGLDGGGDLFYLTVEADQIPVPVPEGGPGTLALTTWALLLVAAARRVQS